MIKSSLVERLKSYVDFITVCPEVEIGLGIPRDPIHLEENQGEVELVQPLTGANYTQEMTDFADSFLDSLEEIDGFILKNKSPSCGIKAVKIYPPGGRSRPRNDGVGLFSSAVIKNFPHHPLEDEGRLRNFHLRENFLTRIYTLADYRENVEEGRFTDLIDFHTRNKLLFLSYSQIHLRSLGVLVSDSRVKPLESIKKEYGEILREMLLLDPQPPANINVLQHAVGHFSKDLTYQEKNFFHDLVLKYREGRIPLLVNQNLLKSWIIRFDNGYLEQQTFFEPYPEDLMDITFL